MTVKTLAEILRAEAYRRGTKDIKALAESVDLPYEEFRKVCRNGNVPKDATLRLYAEKLGFDFPTLAVTAFWQRSSGEVKEVLDLLVQKRQRLFLPKIGEGY